MKKLDEIMELMADEMQDFQNGLLQMKKMTEELNTRSIPISTEVMEKHLKSFFQEQEKRNALIVEAITALNQKLKKAYILPKGLGILVVTCLILLLIIIGYLIFLVAQTY